MSACGDHAAGVAVGKRVPCSRVDVFTRSLERPPAPVARGPVLTVLHRMFTLQGGGSPGLDLFRSLRGIGP
jgi:hypothetical protein